MTLIVQKFGGSSVGSLEKIKQVAQIILAERAKSHDVVVVLSAMQGETDRLIGLANALSEVPDSRAFDALVSTGEQVSTALLAIALNDVGCKARSLSAWQVGLKTDSVHRCARIEALDSELLMDLLLQGHVPIVTGFQGVDGDNNITTLGRGGSDTTAVAIAAKLGADECQIFTDVDGVYTTDPRVEPAARRMSKVTFEEMLELSSLGAKVLQIRSVEFAGKYNVPLRVLSTFEPGPGTIITYEEDVMESPLVSGVAFDRNQAKISLLGAADRPGVALEVMKAISDASIDIDMIVQNVPSEAGSLDLSFTLAKADYKQAMAVIDSVRQELGATSVVGDDHVAKLSVVGVGMRSHAGVATKMFEALCQEGINIHMISTSEIKISVLIDEKYTELGVRSLHSVFGLSERKSD